MTDPNAEIISEIEDGSITDNLASPLSADEIDALIARSQDDPGAPFETDTVARLAATMQADPAGYERLIERLKADKNVRIGSLERQVRDVSHSGDDTRSQGQAVSFPEIIPWGHPVDGAQLLDEIVAQIKRYVTLSDASAHANALWTVHTHCYAEFDFTPRLAITSPEKRCGKTTVLSVIEAMVSRPLGAANITAAAM